MKFAWTRLALSDLGSAYDYIAVPYRVKAKRIEVLALIHGARRWPEEL